jgi:capsid portal protein
MKKLGQTHSQTVVTIYHKILEIDKRYLAKEPDWNDPSYIAKVILINSAVESLKPNQEITKVLDNPPFFLEKHLSYFKDKFNRYFTSSKNNSDLEIQKKNSSKHSFQIDRTRNLSLNVLRADSINLKDANFNILNNISNLFQQGTV